MKEKWMEREDRSYERTEEYRKRKTLKKKRKR